MDREFLRSADFNKKNILEHVLAPNDFDGIRAQRDLSSLVREEQARQFSRKLLWVGLGGTTFSAFNLTRLNQLSSSGRTAALAGTIFFAFFSYSAASRAGFLGRPQVESAEKK
jgi:hypothetical protein